MATTKLTTFYVVLSREGIEGSFEQRGDAEGYLAELREIGVEGLRIEGREIRELVGDGEEEE